MTREELLEAIGRVDDDLIQEAEDCRLPAHRRGLPHWRPLAGGLAACLVLAAVLYLPFGMSGGGDNTTSGAAGSSSAAQEVESESSAGTAQDSGSGSGSGAALPGEPSAGDESSGGASSQEGGRGPGCAAHPRGGVYPHRRDGLRPAGGQPPAGRALPGGGGQPGPVVHHPPGVRRVHAVGGAGWNPLCEAPRKRVCPGPAGGIAPSARVEAQKLYPKPWRNPLESDDSSGFFSPGAKQGRPCR